MLRNITRFSAWLARYTYDNVGRLWTYFQRTDARSHHRKSKNPCKFFDAQIMKITTFKLHS